MKSQPSQAEKKKEKEHGNLYYDIMYSLWNFYHKWIIHKGRSGVREWLICNHRNPYDVLTPNRWRKQVKNIIENNK